MYILPQEIEVWYVIPAIRKELAKVLIEKYDLTFEKAGSILGISKAAVSHYLNKKRADKIKIPSVIKKEIEKSAGIIVKDKNLAVKEIIRILGLIKKSGSSCGLCKKYNKGILAQCHGKPVEGE